MKPFLRQLVLAILSMTFMLPAFSQSGDSVNEWSLKRDRDGIQVFTRPVEGSKHKAVKATMSIQASVHAAVALVRDTDACAEWAALCKESYEDEVVSETELYVYTYNDIPWPVSDRDALAHVVWEFDDKTGAVTMLARATKDRMEKVKGAVRILNAESTWIFQPGIDGQLNVITEAHVDPNGPTPAWITNLLLVDSPFETLSRMRDLIATGRYDNHHFDFIQDRRPTDAAEATENSTP
ncbi:MAG: START domain-containing protein [Pseudomonadota bacterium]